MAWAFPRLTAERWQMLAALPRRRLEDGSWEGTNLTWYGVFWATAATAATALFLALLAGAGFPPRGMALPVLAILAASVPAAGLLARLVEDRTGTLTVAGACSVGALLAPPLFALLPALPESWPLSRPPVVTALAALAIGYCFGEALGRLSCVSFGCCYGVPVERLSDPWRRIFSALSFTFRGRTRKASYASGLDGVPLVPVQALSCATLCLVGLAGLSLFLAGRHTAALLASFVPAMAWRIGSEFLRADDRGNWRVSPYQWLSLGSAAYVVVAAFWWRGAQTPAVDLPAGLLKLWDPAMLLALQTQWVVLLLHSGLSRVTGSTMRFFVRREVE